MKQLESINSLLYVINFEDIEDCLEAFVMIKRLKSHQPPKKRD